ncbi:O-antigen translocase [Ferrovum myxofaciens]|uniref:O-antigen translocase n=1 Tax=Ferrovum myxofaciens TaxID=416213 RepID=UPI003EBD5996
MTTKGSYRQILKSSSIMGGAAGISMLFGILRTKVAALLIGSAGVGMLANLTVIQSLMTTVVGLGIQSSAVQEIAKSETSRDQLAIDRTLLTLNRFCLIAGLSGAAIMATLSHTFSLWMFNSAAYASEIAWLGITIFFGVLSTGQLAMIQGARRIGDLARANVITAGCGTLIAVGCYSWLGIDGILPTLLLMSVLQLIVTWLYSRHIFSQSTKISWTESFREASGMMQLGISLMWSALLVNIVSYVTNILITHQIGLKAVGINSAAFALSGMFVNFVLNAMGADYYPQLTSLAPDKAAMNNLVNEQTEIGLLLAVPGLLATLSLAPWIIHIFYSVEFLQAASLLQWFILGCLIRVIQWPMGFLQLTFLKGRWFFITQTTLNAIHLSLIWTGITLFGIEGVSMAFFSLYVVSLGLIYLVAMHLTDFSWNSSCRKLLMIVIPVVATTFTIVRILPLWPSTILGIATTVISSVLCLRGLIYRIGNDHRLIQAACKIPGMRTVCDLKTEQ